MIENIFQIPIGKYSIDDWENLNKTYALSQYANSFIEEINKENISEGDNLYTDFMTNSKNNRVPQYINNMLGLFTKPAQNFFDDISSFSPQIGMYNWRVTSAWFEKLTSNQIHGAHNHGAIGFSAVLYIDFDSEFHRATTFLSPYGDFIGGVTQMYTPSDIKSGDVIFFPSFLNHYAPKNNSEKERVIFSCNFSPF
jgi:hypothetical protein